MKKKIAIIGTRGLPARYGGFESLAEHLVKYLGIKYNVSVFCSSKIYRQKKDTYFNSKLIYLPLRPNGYQSILYDFMSIILSIRKHDKILVLGASAGILMPILYMFKKKIVLNFGGLEWQRDKWGLYVKKYIKLSEKLFIQNAGVVVADNVGIQEYIKTEYGINSVLIEYGGDQVRKQKFEVNDYDKWKFIKDKYALNVARIQPDNNIEVIIKAFVCYESIPLVIIGNWDGSYYGKELKNKYNNIDNIYLLDAIYDQDILNKIRSNCYIYIHGHSAGGTNPALVEAMNLALPIIAYSSGFNEYTTENKAIYFSDEKNLLSILREKDALDYKNVSEKMHEIALRRYRWSDIVSKYEKYLIND